MSIPARLIISAITMLTLLVRLERVSGVLLFIAVADGLGALATGCVLGFTGKVPEMGDKGREKGRKA